MKSKIFVIVLVSLVFIGSVSAYYFGHHVGYSEGYTSGNSQQEIAKGQINNLSSENDDLHSTNSKLVDQYNALSDTYNSLRNAVIQYVGTSSNYRPSVHCTTMNYGINDQFSSINCQ